MAEHIIETIHLVKGNKDRFWDFAHNQQGYSIQRNGRTITGRLNGYGGKQLFEEYVQDDLDRGWEKVEEDYRSDDYLLHEAVTTGKGY